MVAVTEDLAAPSDVFGYLHLFGRRLDHTCMVLRALNDGVSKD